MHLRLLSQVKEEAMSYDQHCLDLAQSFLDDTPHLRDREGRAPKLAQAIQDVIEDWLNDWEDEDRAELESQREIAADTKREQMRDDALEEARTAADMRRKEIREDGR